jgi:hypothetical protein
MEATEGMEEMLWERLDIKLEDQKGWEDQALV